MRPTRGTDKVSPVIALALLHSLRATDTPEEIIEDESFRISLPRRLGLNEVVDSQMRRYAEIGDRRGTISPDEFRSLLALIDRRPDDEAVFAAAGRSLAESRFSEPGALERLGGRLTPRRVRRRRLIRSMIDVARAVEPGGSVSPVADAGVDGIAVENPLLADATAGGSACALLTAALEVCATRLAGEDSRVVHDLCAGRGDDQCRWVVEEAGGST